MSETAPTHGTPTRPRRAVAILGWLVIVVVAATVLGALYVKGGGSLPGWLAPVSTGPLDPSSPEEAVLRTLRLAGYDRAVVGYEDGVVVVRIAVPYVRTPADVELSWQTALAAALGAWPDADRFVAQVFADEMALVEVGIAGDDLREIVQTPRAGADPAPATELEMRADVRLLTATGFGA